MTSDTQRAGVTIARLEDMLGGWFVGAFQPAVLASDAMEVAVKRYPAGAKEAVHVHLVATEVSLLVEGRARMAGRDIGPGDIVVLSPGTASGLETFEPCTMVVVKSPSVLGDKYLLEEG